MAIVSWHPDIKNIQDQIAYMLGLRLIDHPNETERSIILCARLEDVKRIPVIYMYFIWESQTLVTKANNMETLRHSSPNK